MNLLKNWNKTANKYYNIVLNILSSSSLINSGGVVDELLKRKVLDKDLLVDDIIEEDRQAILIFLRNTAFGTEYTVVTTDPQTDQTFSANVDLSTLKVKDFNLQEKNSPFRSCFSSLFYL